MTHEPLPRSFLFAPGSQERLLSKVFAAGADAVVLDLEDAVAPADKERARGAVAEAVAARGAMAGPAVWVRINELGGPLWRDDVRAVARPGLCGVRVPKVESAEHLAALSEALATAEESVGLESGSLRIHGTVESARGLVAVPRLAEQPRLERLAFGEADFLADIGGESDADGIATLFARSQLVVASRAAGLAPPIASVHTRLEDDAGLEDSTEQARRLGFWGRSCIHPRQLAVVHRVFGASAAEVREARATLAAWEAAGGGAALGEDGKFIDRAVVRRARGLLARARGPGREEAS